MDNSTMRISIILSLLVIAALMFCYKNANEKKESVEYTYDMSPSGVFKDFIPKEYDNRLGSKFQSIDGKVLRLTSVDKFKNGIGHERMTNYIFNVQNTPLSIELSVGETYLEFQRDMLRLNLINYKASRSKEDGLNEDSRGCVQNFRLLQVSPNKNTEPNIMPYYSNVQFCKTDTNDPSKVDYNCFCGFGICYDEETREPYEYNICLERGKGIISILMNGVNYILVEYDTSHS